MEDDKFMELKEAIITSLHQFVRECRKLGYDEDMEVDDLMIDMWDGLNESTGNDPKPD